MAESYPCNCSLCHRHGTSDEFLWLDGRPFCNDGDQCIEVRKEKSKLRAKQRMDPLLKKLDEYIAKQKPVEFQVMVGRPRAVDVPVEPMAKTAAQVIEALQPENIDKEKYALLFERACPGGCGGKAPPGEKYCPGLPEGRRHPGRPHAIHLWAHLVATHAAILAPTASFKEMKELHDHEHQGPCTIRNHDPKDRSYSLKKLGQVLAESEE